jgi:hypothetical protein
MEKSADHQEMGVLPTVGQFPIAADKSAFQTVPQEDEAAAVPVAMAPSTSVSTLECRMKYSQSCSSVESVPREEPDDCPAVK